MSQKSTGKVWRESASLILVVRDAQEHPANNPNGLDYDYKVLLLKRSERTAIVPNQVVFPGGIFEKSDESVAWLQYFEECGVTQQMLRQLIVVGDAEQERPRILAPQGNGCYDRFFKCAQIWAREISLRITAIRETFEEAGVLLCRDRSEIQAPTVGCGHVKRDIDVAYWQQRVHDEPTEFLQLCRELAVVPDLWALYEWSAWASPAPIKKGFETVFFIAFLSERPRLLIESSEIMEGMWYSPAICMQLYFKDILWLMPPQIYELTRLMNIGQFEALLKFAQERNSKGTTLYLPVGYVCSDGFVSVLPGDDFYVPDPRNFDDFITIDSTIAEFRAKTKRLHRSENAGRPDMKLLLNFEPPNGHLCPVPVILDVSKL